MRARCRLSGLGRPVPASGGSGVLGRRRGDGRHRDRVVGTDQRGRRGRAAAGRAPRAGFARSRCTAERSSAASPGAAPPSASRGSAGTASLEAPCWSPRAMPGSRRAALDVELSLDPDAPGPLVHRSRVRVHLGTAEMIGTGRFRARRSSRAARPRATRARGARGGPRRRPVRHSQLQPGRHDRWRAWCWIPSRHAGRQVARGPWRSRAGGAPDGAGRAPARWNRDRDAARAAGAAAGRGAWPSPRARTDSDWSGISGSPRPRSASSAPGALATSQALSSRASDRAGHAAGDAAPLGFARPMRWWSGPGRRGGGGPAPAADGVAALAGFAPRVEGGDAAMDEMVRILEEAGLSPAKPGRAGAADRAAGRRRRFSGSRPRPAGSRRWSATATTPGRRWSGSSGHPGRGRAVAASSRRPSCATAWGSVEST